MRKHPIWKKNKAHNSESTHFVGFTFGLAFFSGFKGSLLTFLFVYVCVDFKIWSGLYFYNFLGGRKTSSSGTAAKAVLS